MKRPNRLYFLHHVDAVSLENVLVPLRQRCPEPGISVILAEADKQSVSTIQSVCRKNGIALIGAIFPQLVKDETFCPGGAWIICFDRMPYYILEESVPEDSGRIEQKIGNIARRISFQIDGRKDMALYMIFEASLLNISTIIDLLYLNLANSIRYAGINAGSESFKPMPCLFDNERLVSGGMLLFLMQENKGAVLEHGYHVSAQTVYATSVEKNCIFQINWRPAFEVYQQLVYAQYGVQINKENFYKYSVYFPFGIRRANGQMVLRIPVSLEEDGTLFCAGEIPANSVLTLLRTPRVDSSQTIQALSNGLKAMYGDTLNEELLLFYCAGRRAFIGAGPAAEELHAFRQTTQASVIAGALSLGEIGGASLDDYPLFHHATLLSARL